MKIFISWSGPLSQRVAEALRDWLPSVLQLAEPWVSSEDIAKGSRWGVEVGHELDDADFGIICVTPGNEGARWLNFEAGGLAKAFEQSLVSPFLFGVDHEAIAGGPLAQFQGTQYDQHDVLRLIRSINSKSGAPLPELRLIRAVSQWWPSLKDALDPLLKQAQAEADEPQRNHEVAMAELLELARAQAERTSAERASALLPTPQLKGESRGGVDTGEVTYYLARLLARTGDVVPHRPDTEAMVEIRATVTMLSNALAPALDLERLASLTQLYIESFTRAEDGKAARRAAGGLIGAATDQAPR